MTSKAWTTKRSAKDDLPITILGPPLTPDEMREHSENLWRVVREAQRQYLISAVLKRRQEIDDDD